MRIIVILILSLGLVSCKDEQKTRTLETGTYRAVLEVSDHEELPFLFEVEAHEKIKIFNAQEKIEVDEISYINDSVYIKMPVYEGYLVAKIEDSTLTGSFVKESLNRVVPFVASQSTKRFIVENATDENVEGIWETDFSPNSDDHYIAKGIFKQEGNKVTGTFRTTTGDYRYLEGAMDGNVMKLSTFDGAHAFLFTAVVNDSTMSGTFYSGNHWKEPFVAKRNSKFELPDANSLTYLKDGYDKIEFSFPNEDGKTVSLEDERFKDKVVLVQIMGTWCPNCLDESKFYADYYKKNKSEDLEIVALAFEYAKSEKKAFNNIKRLRERTGIEYPILLAQVGSSSKAKANDKLPMLNHVLSYPTTIYIDKNGKVRKIHTGFNGPATGEKYTEFVNEFEKTITELTSE